MDSAVHNEATAVVTEALSADAKVNLAVSTGTTTTTPAAVVAPAITTTTLEIHPSTGAAIATPTPTAIIKQEESLVSGHLAPVMSMATGTLTNHVPLGSIVSMTPAGQLTGTLQDQLLVAVQSMNNGTVDGSEELKLDSTTSESPQLATVSSTKLNNTAQFTAGSQLATMMNVQGLTGIPQVATIGLPGLTNLGQLATSANVNVSLAAPISTIANSVMATNGTTNVVTSHPTTITHQANPTALTQVAMPQFILAGGHLLQGIQGAQLLIPTSSGVEANNCMATQQILTIPINQVSSGQMVQLVTSNGQVFATTLNNLQGVAQPQPISVGGVSSTSTGSLLSPDFGHYACGGAIATQQIATQQLTTQQLATQQLATQQLATQQLATQQFSTQQLATQQLATQQLATQQLATQQLATQQLVPGNIQSMNGQMTIPHIVTNASGQVVAIGPQLLTQPMMATNQTASLLHFQGQSGHITADNKTAISQVVTSATKSQVQQTSAPQSIAPSLVQQTPATQIQIATVGASTQLTSQNVQRTPANSQVLQVTQNQVTTAQQAVTTSTPTVDLPNTISQSDANTVDGINLEEIKEFAKAFKIRRLSLGLTQTQVGQALSITEGPAYSQSAICRFEKLDITPKSAQKIKPVLERWMKEAEERYKNGAQNLTEFIGTEPSKKRKRRTSFTPQALDILNQHFERNTHPSGAEMTELAEKLNYDREVVRVWFCNKRQALKNTIKKLKTPL